MKHTYVTHHILFYLCPLFDMHLHLKFQVILQVIGQMGEVWIRRWRGPRVQRIMVGWNFKLSTSMFNFFVMITKQLT